MDTPNLAFLLAGMNIIKTNLLGSSPTTPKVHLAKAAFTPTPTLDVGTLAEADFTGYSSKAISSWGTTHRDSFNQELIVATSAAAWTPTDGVTPNTIYGWWMVGSDGSTVACGVFNPPLPMTSAANTIELVVGVAYGPWQFTAVLLP